MFTVVPLSPSLESLRPTSQGIAIIPRSRSTSRTPSGDLQWKNALKSDSASSVQSVADENLSLADIESMLSQKVGDRKDDLKAAFRAFDQESRGTITKGEFRRVIEGFLVPLTQSQFEALLAKRNGTIPYLDFLRQYCRVSSGTRIPSVGGSHRRWPLGELQCRLKDKIGGNLKNITRAFRLFDYNRDGRIQQHELRRVLESYCFPLSQQEFHRLWSHYSPNNSQTISYKEFLERLGVDCENYRKIAPDSVKLALNWDAVNRSTARPKSRTAVWTASSETADSLDEIHTKFLKKMSSNYAFVERALQAFDVKDRGVVSHDDLKSVLSSFLFPISDRIFPSLLSRFGVNPAEPVEWRKFIGLFREDVSIRKDTGAVTPDLSSFEEVLSKLREQILKVFPLLKRGFLVLDESRTGVVSRPDLRRLLESLTIRLTDEQFKGLIDFFCEPNSGTVNYQHFMDFIQQKRPAVGQEQSSKPPEQPETQCQLSAVSPSSTATWPTVEEILKEKLSEQYDSLMVSLSLADPMQSCCVPPEDLRKLIQQYGLPLSDSHFNKLCEPFIESGGVNYKLLMMSLGLSKIRKIRSANKSPSIIERSVLRLCLKSLENNRTGKQEVVDVVLRRLRDRLQMHGVTLEHYLMAICRSAAMLDLRDFQKILDDCRISLQVPEFQILIQALGFCDGQISFAEFVAKYEDAVQKENEEQRIKSSNIKASSVMSAEDCFNQLEKRIKDVHGDVLTAFRLMDRNRDGLVYQNDFRVLFDSLKFVTKEQEYQRLLKLLGFKPGSNLNYAEFFHKIQPNKRNGLQLITNMTADQLLERACEQVHTYLMTSVRTEWGKFSKTFCQYGEDGESIITKNDLRNVLYKYYLPITPREFEKIWARYDDDGKGYVTQTEFLDKLNIVPNEFTQPVSPKEKPTNRTACTTPLTETTLHRLRDRLKLSLEDVSNSLVSMDKSRDGNVTVTDLLSLLNRHGFQIEEFQLLHLINNLGVNVTHSKLSYLDFLEHLAGPGAVMASPRSQSRGSPTPGEDVGELSPDRALQRVRELVTTFSDTLSKAFKAFDKTKNGMIAQPEFRRVLDHFCIRLSDVQYKKLLAKLSVRDGEETMVDWKQFLQTFNLRNQETSEEWLEKVQKMRFPNQAHPLPISDILQRIREVVTARLYTITKEMVDLDYASMNAISKEHFKVICDHHFMRLTVDQFEKLWKMLPVNSHGRLDYREFLKKFSGEMQEQEKPGVSPSPDRLVPSESSPAVLPQCPKSASCILERSKSLTPEQPKRPSTVCGRISVPLDPEAVEQTLRSQIRGCWRRVQRRCREADPGRTGEIDKEAFLDILENLHIDLTQPQFEQLSEKYNISKNGHVCYSEFLQHFVLMLRPQANTCTGRRKLHLPRTPMSAGPLSRLGVDALLRLFGPIQLNWRTIRRTFVSYDKERTGKISVQDFRKVLRQYNVNISEEDFFHLTSFLDKNISGKISYNEFLCIFQK
ncbi:LOW QUALITY PROTEIN: EF-hand calcium-binding domain-containing protein 6 [Colossoma macropomum]|uniref:LOW QUALITY PROTEIN: EF-hand calcium-binding domain-containing protein 6 n=1 Tax=Colossoma macropomum TaxID=42526 RepID=UPI001863CDC4|nr:LOW QUALITY PROTEIN: EF-hand calcium-binding domain-containing protein 6 [Colossoma macropomum]